MAYVVVVFAAYRLTRLAVRDTLFNRQRRWIRRQNRWMNELFDCHWCAGFWVSGAVLALAGLGLGWREFVVGWFAVAGAQSLVHLAEKKLS